MEFDLISFTLSPSLEVFEKCRKKDLVLIAEFFNIVVPREATKRVIKDLLFKKLVEEGVLPMSSEESLGEPEVFPNADSIERFDPALVVKLKELDLLIKEKEYDSEVIRLRQIEAEKDCEIQLRKLDLEAQALLRKPVPLPRSRPPSGVMSPGASYGSVRPPMDAPFDVSRYITLVPPFREAEVDAYFVAFERIAGKLVWPKDMWALLLQCSLSGKAREVCSALPLEQSLDYDVVKAAVLRAYELVPEAYRQKFRAHVKTPKQNYVEFAREKRSLFEKWCFSSKIDTLEQLQELILLEDFKKSLPEKVVIYLNEQKVALLSEAAVHADEYALTHRKMFLPERVCPNPSQNERACREDSALQFSHSFKGSSRFNPSANSAGREKNKRVCFYCLDPTHMIADCKVEQKRFASENTSH